MTYADVENETERLKYVTGDNPSGPFRVTGAIMDVTPSGCWTNYHSIIGINDHRKTCQLISRILRLRLIGLDLNEYL